MDFQVTSQRGEFEPVSCSGGEELNEALKSLNLSVWDGVCNEATPIQEVLDQVGRHVAVGWSARIGWVYVGLVEK